MAIKVVRSDLTRDPEFLGRFRSEVARARQVPPYCTAEVLDPSGCGWTWALGGGSARSG